MEEENISFGVSNCEAVDSQQHPQGTAQQGRSPDPSKRPSGEEGATSGPGLSCSSYQIRRNCRGDEGVGPVDQRAADDEHRCKAGTAVEERGKEIKSSGGGRTSARHPHQLAVPCRRSPRGAATAQLAPTAPEPARPGEGK